MVGGKTGVGTLYSSEEESEDDESFSGLSAWDELGSVFAQELANVACLS